METLDTAAINLVEDEAVPGPGAGASAAPLRMAVASRQAAPDDHADHPAGAEDPADAAAEPPADAEASHALVAAIDDVYGLLARLPDSADDLLLLLRSRRDVARALGPVRIGGGQVMARADLVRELKAWTLGRDGLRAAIERARTEPPFDPAEEAAILRAAAGVPDTLLGFPAALRERTAQARRRVQAAERFTEALYLRNAERIIALWDQEPALRELTLAQDEGIAARVGEAHLAMAAYRRFLMLCAAELVDEAAICETWANAPELQRSPLSLLQTVDGMTLAARAALAQERWAHNQALAAAAVAARSRPWTDRVAASTPPPSRLSDELALLLGGARRLLSRLPAPPAGLAAGLRAGLDRLGPVPGTVLRFSAGAAVVAGLWLLLRSPNPPPATETAAAPPALAPAALAMPAPPAPAVPEPAAPAVPEPAATPATAAVPPPAAAKPAIGTVIVTAALGVRIRSAPDGNAAIVRLVPANAKLRVFERSAGWVQVGDDQPWGWVNARLVGPPPG